MPTHVNNKKELAAAIKNKKKIILITNKKLGEKVLKFKGKYKKDEFETPAGLAMAFAGMEVVWLVALTILGIITLYALHKDYNVKIKSGEHEVTLERA